MPTLESALSDKVINVCRRMLGADELSAPEVAAVPATDWIRFPGCGRKMIADIWRALDLQGLDMPRLGEYLEWEYQRNRQRGEDLSAYVERWKREHRRA